MNIIEIIQKDFILAMKTKNSPAKAALSSLKSKITEAVKANNNTEISESEVTKLIVEAIKQRKEEMVVLQQYLPTQMSEADINYVCTLIIAKIEVGFKGPERMPDAMLQGKTMEEFNKLYQGQADPKIVIQIIKRIISS